MKLPALTANEELKYASESIAESIEAGVQRLGHYSSKLAELLPGIKRGLSDTDQVGPLAEVTPLPGNQQAFLALVNRHSYLELREIKAFVPEGLKQSFLSALNELEKAALRCKALRNAVLLPYSIFLAALVSNPDGWKSLDNRQDVHNALQVARDSHQAAYGALFEHYDRETRLKLGQAVERNSDWSLVFQKLNTVSSLMNAIKRSEIDEGVKQVEDYLDILYRQLDSGKLKDVNPEVTQALADGAYQLGCELEFFAITYYRVLALKTAIEATQAEVLRVLK